MKYFLYFIAFFIITVIFAVIGIELPYWIMEVVGGWFWSFIFVIVINLFYNLLFVDSTDDSRNQVNFNLCLTVSLILTVVIIVLNAISLTLLILFSLSSILLIVFYVIKNYGWRR